MKCDDFGQDTNNALLEPRVCVESVRAYVAVSTWTTVTKGWDKHADNVSMRKTSARTVCCLHPQSIDCQEIQISGKRKQPLILGLSKKHGSLQDEDFHKSHFHTDHKSLLGCHRDDEDEDESAVEEG